MEIISMKNNKRKQQAHSFPNENEETVKDNSPVLFLILIIFIAIVFIPILLLSILPDLIHDAIHIIIDAIMGILRIG